MTLTGISGALCSLVFIFFARCANNARYGESHESKGMPSKLSDDNQNPMSNQPRLISS
jgi:hypothetical protein